jgi:hypothetical protein
MLSVCATLLSTVGIRSSTEPTWIAWGSVASADAAPMTTAEHTLIPKETLLFFMLSFRNESDHRFSEATSNSTRPQRANSESLSAKPDMAINFSAALPKSRTCSQFQKFALV